MNHNYQPEQIRHICRSGRIHVAENISRELNLAVKPQIAITRILADLNLAVRYGIAIRIYVSRKFWWILIWWL